MKKPKDGVPTDPGPPAASELATRLGGAHRAFETLASRPGTEADWKRYGKNAPWVLRVSQEGRTLFYLNPGVGSFETTVVLGARATEAALGGRVSKGLHGAIRSARAYAEGRPVRVVVTKKADLAGIEELLAVKLDPGAARKPAGKRRAPSARSGRTKA